MDVRCGLSIYMFGIVSGLVGFWKRAQGSIENQFGSNAMGCCSAAHRIEVRHYLHLCIQYLGGKCAQIVGVRNAQAERVCARWEAKYTPFIILYTALIVCLPEGLKRFGAGRRECQVINRQQNMYFVFECVPTCIMR